MNVCCSPSIKDPRLHLLGCGGVFAVVGLALSLASRSACATNIIVNPGFETGERGPWDSSTSFDPDGASVVGPAEGRTDDFALHLDAGEFDDFYHVTQDLPPTPTDLISGVSLWSYSPTSRWGTPVSIVLYFNDNTTSNVYFSLTPEWEFVDATEALIPGKVLQQIEIDWRGLGDEGPSSEAFIDDVVVNVIPSPAASAAFGFCFLSATSRRPRRNK